MSKVRKVDFSPDEFIAGTVGFTPVELGVYWFTCALIYSTGGAIPQDDERFRGLKCDPRTIRATIKSLTEKGKIVIQDDGEMIVRRVQDELERASRRIQDASEKGLRGGRPRTRTQQYQQDTKADPLFSQKLSPSPSPSPSPISIEGAIAPRSPNVKGSRLGKDWQPVRKHFELAEQLNLTTAEVWASSESFREYFHSPDAARPVKKDWDGAFSRWLRTDAPRINAGRARGQRPQGNGAQRASALAVRDILRAEAGLQPDRGAGFLRTEGGPRPAGDAQREIDTGAVIDADEVRRGG